MCIEHLFRSLVADGLYLSHDIGMVALELIVDDDHSVIGKVRGNITAVARNVVEIVRYLLELQFRRSLGILRVSHPGAERSENRRGKTYQERLGHAKQYTRFRLGDSGSFSCGKLHLPRFEDGDRSDGAHAHAACLAHG